MPVIYLGSLITGISAPKVSFQQGVQEATSSEATVELLKLVRLSHRARAKNQVGLPNRASELIISKHLAEIFNECISSETFPDIWKISKVVPIYKSANFDAPENYRQISLLNALSKVFEKIIHSRMTKFAFKCKLLCKKQFGFQSQISCINSISDLNEEIRVSIDKKNGVLCLLDLQKAFDTVDHKCLLYKLEQMGYRGKIANLISSYLENRKQYVCFNQQNSSSKSLTCGVPQALVLGYHYFSFI